MEPESRNAHDRAATESVSSTESREPRGRRLDDAQRRIAALSRRQPEPNEPEGGEPGSVVDELAEVAQELAVAQEQLRRQTTQLEHARQLLESERSRFRELFEVAPEGHIITDASGTIREVNRGAAGLLNIPPDYLLGKPLAVFVNPDDRHAFRVRVYRARAQLAEEAWTMTLLPRESEPMRVFVAVSPLQDDRGSVMGLRWLVRDVSKHRATAVYARTPAAILRSAIDAMSAHIVVLEADGTIVTANNAWRDAALAGGLFERAVAQGNYLDLCDAAICAGCSDVDSVRSAVIRVLSGSEPRAEAVYGSCVTPPDEPTDSDRWFMLRVTRCDGPEPAMAVVTHEDVTAQIRAQARETALITERSARSAAEEANRAKSEFLATLSHELRTPLNAIAGYAQLLEMGVRGPVTRQQAEDLRRILRSEQHLLGLINDLLNYTRVERGDVVIDLAPVRVRDAMTEVIELVEPQAIAKGLTVSAECPDAELHAMADPDRLRQILLNLLSNAVKFTPEGGTIDVSCAADSDRALVCVRDTGIGIPKEKQEEVFDPFVQVDRGARTSTGGIGLGLAIARSLARAMNGDVTVRSEPGEGSNFELTLSRATHSAAVS